MGKEKKRRDSRRRIDADASRDDQRRARTLLAPLRLKIGWPRTARLTGSTPSVRISITQLRRSDLLVPKKEESLSGGRAIPEMCNVPEGRAVSGEREMEYQLSLLADMSG